MANGNVSYPYGNNQLPYHEIAMRAAALHAVICDVFVVELQKISPDLDFHEGLIIYYFGIRDISKTESANEINKLFELGYLATTLPELSLSDKGMKLQNRLISSLGFLKVPSSSISVLDELTKEFLLKRFACKINSLIQK